MRSAAALLCAAALAGCGAAAPPTGRVGPEPEPIRIAPAVPGAPALQVSNGPLAVDPRTEPIAVRLSDLEDPVRIPFRRPPRSGLLFDLDSGEVLWRRDPARIVPVASLTKMMTALVVAERLRPRDRARITGEVLRYTGSGVGLLPRGRRVTVNTLLHGLMLVSGNDAAIALAIRAAGSQRAFVARMNERAREMGMTCTRYASPSGIVDAGNHSCAADLAAQARAILDDPWLARVVSRRRAVLPFPIKGGRLHLSNTNPLLRSRYPGAIGIKTGFTDAAGRCFVGAARRGGRRLGVVLLDSVDPGRHARLLLDAGFRATAR